VQALAYAAAAVLLACGLFLSIPGSSPDPITEVNTIIALVSPEEELAGDSTSEDAAREERIRELADRLLAIEGFTGDDFEGTLDLLSPLEAPVPTATQWHNTTGSRA
jgi:hypothetical protein